MQSFWNGFEKRAAIPRPGIQSGLFSRGGISQTAAKAHPLPTTGMKMAPLKESPARISGPGVGSMPVP